MRKRVGPYQPSTDARDASSAWLPLEAIAEVEVSSEAPGHPIEAALAPGRDPSVPAGWRAADPGRQIIRLHLNPAQALRRVRVVFQEAERHRTQEFVLRGSAGGGPGREIVRQQYNLAPPAASQETEDYTVALDRVDWIELEIIPDISDATAVASLAEFRLG